jgi:hypothetical protein
VLEGWVEGEAEEVVKWTWSHDELEKGFGDEDGVEDAGEYREEYKDIYGDEEKEEWEEGYGEEVEEEQEGVEAEYENGTSRRRTSPMSRGTGWREILHPDRSV